MVPVLIRGFTGAMIPGEVKMLDREELVELAESAARRHLSRGRSAEWMTANLAPDSMVVLRVALPEASPEPCYRCLVRARLNGGTSTQFPLDVLPGDFTQLRDLADAPLLQLLHELLDMSRVDPVPSDHPQILR